MHPLAVPGNRSGAFDMNAGDRIVHHPDGKRGVADEFLHDGDALVTLDDGTFATLKWNQMSRELPEPPSAGLEARLFAFLARTYRQTADERQKAMGLQYTTAETHDLARTVAGFLAAEGGAR